MDHESLIGEWLTLKDIAEHLGLLPNTLHTLLPDTIRALMESDGTSTKTRYHRKYLPALREIVGRTDARGKRLVKPGNASEFLRPLIDAVNRGEEIVNDSPQAVTVSHESGIMIHGSDAAGRVATALEMIAQQAQLRTPDKLLTREEAVTEFGVSPSSLKEIRYLREGRTMKWNRSDVAQYVASRFMIQKT